MANKSVDPNAGWYVTYNDEESRRSEDFDTLLDAARTANHLEERGFDNVVIHWNGDRQRTF